MSYPRYGTRPIKCSNRKCKWKGYETELSQVPSSIAGIKSLQSVCPLCGCESYFLLKGKEVESFRSISGLDTMAAKVSESAVKRLVSLGDLFADSCKVCSERAMWGYATKKSVEGCREAVETGEVYCSRHTPVPLRS